MAAIMPFSALSSSFCCRQRCDENIEICNLSEIVIASKSVADSQYFDSISFFSLRVDFEFHYYVLVCISCKCRL